LTVVSLNCVLIQRESDVAEASRKALKMAQETGFDKLRSYYIATAASELASNVFMHGGGGKFEVWRLASRPGIEMLASDSGPGIANIELALTEGYSTKGSLGCGLSGTQRLMDELVIQSDAAQGTKVRACKWL
jgi:serine/threonine-protein kinase RsbT